MTSLLLEEPESGEVAEPELPPPGSLRHIITGLILFGPLIGVVLGSVLLFRGEVTAVSIGIGVVFYLVSGHGLSAGYHRMLTHRGYHATRGTKIVLVLAGSLTFQGGPLSWVANHRQHHAYTDVEGDPHSPHLGDNSVMGQLRGAFHAHIGWLFTTPDVDVQHWIPDLVNDRDLIVIDRLFPLMCAVSLGAPALIGWAITGTLAGAVGGFIWGGLVRVFLLQHATFAVNSACHMWGKRPFETRKGDQARNIWPLLFFAMGDNWHNGHHAFPVSPRHGIDPHQWDSTARLVWFLEKTHRVFDVRWPDEATIAARRRSVD